MCNLNTHAADGPPCKFVEFGIKWVRDFDKNGKLHIVLSVHREIVNLSILHAKSFTQILPPASVRQCQKYSSHTFCSSAPSDWELFLSKLSSEPFFGWKSGENLGTMSSSLSSLHVTGPSSHGWAITSSTVSRPACAKNHQHACHIDNKNHQHACHNDKRNHNIHAFLNNEYYQHNT